jgi:hypothetical protein
MGRWEYPTFITKHYQWLHAISSVGNDFNLYIVYLILECLTLKAQPCLQLREDDMCLIDRQCFQCFQMLWCQTSLEGTCLIGKGIRYICNSWSASHQSFKISNILPCCFDHQMLDYVFYCSSGIETLVEKSNTYIFTWLQVLDSPK